MKKVVLGLSIFLLAVFLAGCLNTNSYENKEDSSGELSLLDEIAQIEKELGLSDSNLTKDNEMSDVDVLEDLEEEVILPELGEDDLEVQTLTVNENELVKLSVKANDPDEDEIALSYSSPLNSLGQWQTSYGDAGEYLVTITATDGQLTTKKKVAIVVNRVNVAPVIGPVKDIVVKEGKTVEFKPQVSDPNGDQFTVSISEPLSKGIFSTDHTSEGEYKIVVTASDGELESQKTFNLVVQDVNVLPELSGLNDMKIKEGEIVKIEPKVEDLDGDEVKVMISEPVGDDGVWQTGFTDHGEYIVTVTANDGKQAVTKKITLVVEDVNKAPEFVEVTLKVN